MTVPQIPFDSPATRDALLECTMTKTLPVVFVVDDDKSVRQAMKRLMKSVGFLVETFPAAEDFLISGRQDVPDCLILDVRMPGRSGLELQAELAASGSMVPIIFISAHEDEEAHSRAMRAGAVAFLQKPFEEQALLEALHEAMRGHPPEDRESLNAS